MPRADGHALVSPKTPARNILDIGADDLATLIVGVQKVAKAVKAAGLDWNPELVMGLSVPLVAAAVYGGVHRVRRALDTGHGGVIAQCKLGKYDPKENIEAVFEAWLE